MDIPFVDSFNFPGNLLVKVLVAITFSFQEES